MAKQLQLMLKSFSFFNDFPDSVIGDLAETLELLSLEKNEVLFNKGDQGDALFIVQSGQLKMVIENQDGNEVVLNQVGKGAIIGEMSLIDQNTRSAGVVALDKVELLKLSEENFMRIFNDQPVMGLQISRALITRLRFATTYIENAIEWSQMIAKGDYSFINKIDSDSNIGDNQGDQNERKNSWARFFKWLKKSKLEKTN